MKIHQGKCVVFNLFLRQNYGLIRQGKTKKRQIEEEKSSWSTYPQITAFTNL